MKTITITEEYLEEILKTVSTAVKVIPREIVISFDKIKVSELNSDPIGITVTRPWTKQDGPRRTAESFMYAGVIVTFILV